MKKENRIHTVFKYLGNRTGYFLSGKLQGGIYMSVWFTGEIRKNMEEYKVVDLDKSYLQRLINFQEKVYKTINDKDTFVKSREEEYEEFLGGGGKILGFMINNKLVGYRIISYNKEEIDHFAEMLKLDTNKDMLYLDSTIIRKEYRGNHLQRKAIELSLKDAGNNANFKYAFATVSPKNIPSIKSLLYNKVYITKGRKIYGGKDRFICMYDKDIEIKESREKLFMPLKQYENISNHLENGYMGIHIHNNDDEFLLELIKQ